MEQPTGPSPIDHLFQLAYKSAYQLMRAYWTLRKPTTHGALVTLWNRGEVLLVRNSYLSYYSLPGGYLRSGETGRAAATRELYEEVGFSAREDELVLALEVTHLWQGKHDHVQIFTLDVAERPSVEVDHREVVEASWLSPSEALKLELFPPLRTVIEERLKLTNTKH